jgi:hypothetical protein
MGFPTPPYRCGNLLGTPATDAPGDVGEAMRDPKLAAQLNDTSFSSAAGFVLSVEYDRSGYSGDSVTFMGAAGCTLTLDDIDHQVASLPPWEDDQISSIQWS